MKSAPVEDCLFDRVSCVSVPRMNNRYTMIGFENGKVQIRMTETLEEPKFEH